MQNESQKNSGKRLIIIALLASLGWLGVAVYIGYELRADDGWSHPNTIGDFLAGIFAPLAFAWLAIAVLLQRHELIAQRKQLNQNGEALELQALELRKTVEELEKQTLQITQSTQSQSSAITWQGVVYEQRLLASFLLDGISNLKVQLSQVIQNNEECHLSVCDDKEIENLERHLKSGLFYQFFGLYLDKTIHFGERLKKLLDAECFDAYKNNMLTIHWFAGNGLSHIEDYYDAIFNLPKYNSNKASMFDGSLMRLEGEFNEIVKLTSST